VSASVDMSQLLKGLADAQARGRAAAVRAMDQVGEQAIGDSQQLCPVDTGALAASGTTLPAEISGTNITKVIGHNVNYAAAVHERYSTKPAGEESKADSKSRKSKNKAAGKKTAKRNRQGQGKFLETAVRNIAPKIPAYVSGAMREAL
jgi:hypothetical protein